MIDCPNCRKANLRVLELEGLMEEMRIASIPPDLFDLGREEVMAKWRKALGVTPMMCRIVARFCYRPGEMVSRSHLFDVMTRNEDAGAKMIDVQICRIRQRLKSLGLGNPISNQWGSGYTLSKEGAEAIMARVCG